MVCYKSAQPTMLFERRLRDGQSEIEFNTKNGDKVSQVVQEKITVECLNNMSFFVARDKANANMPLIDAAKNWMRGQVMTMISPQTDLTSYAQSRTSIDKGLVNYILDFLKEADFNITNIDSDTITRTLSEEGLMYVLENDRIPNEEKEINVTFPADYHAEDLAGAAVVFKVKVHEIKTKVLPEIDDELAMDANIDGVETLEQLQAHIKEEIRTRKQNDAENKFNEELVSALIAANEFTVPSVMVDSELEKMVGDIQNNLQQQGISLDLYLKFLGKTPEEFKEELKGQAERRVKYNLILAAVVKAENIEVTDEDVDNELAEIAKKA